MNFYKLLDHTDRLYLRALHRIGIPDGPEMRVTAAVTVSVLLFYIVAAVAAVADLITASAPILTALLLI